MHLLSEADEEDKCQKGLPVHDDASLWKQTVFHLQKHQEMYSKKMVLSYDPCSLIFSSLDESGEEIRNDLLRYINEFYERRRYASFLCEETEYYQITLLDLFPEIMSQEAYKMYN